MDILEGAKFGDKFKTRDGRKALYLGGGESHIHYLVIENDWQLKRCYYINGHHSFDSKIDLNQDIVDRWIDSVDEEKLDRLAMQSYPLDDDSHWNLYQCERQEAFKVGYRKAKEI